MKAITTTIAILILALSLPIVNATQYWVSPFGSDSNSGRSQTTPFKTFNKAVGVSNHGDVITAMPGLYTGTLNTVISIYYEITINSIAGVEQTIVSGPGGWTIKDSTRISGIQFTNFPTSVFIVENFSTSSLETFTLNEVLVTNNNLVISLKSDYNNIDILNSNLIDNNNTIISSKTQRKGEIELTNSIFTNSGAIVGYFYDVIVQNTTFQHCKCELSGCALSLNQTHSLFVNESSFIDISTLADGGAIYLSKQNSDVRIVNSFFNDNSADGFGGAIYSMQSIDIFASIFDSNYATVGGAVYLRGQSGVSTGANIVGSEFTHNTAKTSGGAVYCEYNVVSYQYVEFSDNSAPIDPSYQCGVGCSSILFNVIDDYPSTCSP